MKMRARDDIQDIFYLSLNENEQREATVIVEVERDAGLGQLIGANEVIGKEQGSQTVGSSEWSHMNVTVSPMICSQRNHYVTTFSLGHDSVEVDKSLSLEARGESL